MINLADIINSEDPNKEFDNRYLLKEKIGGGGFSEVWLAHDTIAKIDVALKIYTPNGDLDEEGKEDFKREFGRLCGLNHSNIIHAIGFGIHDEELPYLAMNVCKNGSAKKLIGNYEEKQLWDFIDQVASGLQYLHSHDITHQDIKPDNILLNTDGQYLIIDFGISTKTRNTLRKTNRESVGGGTPCYMSSESYKPESSDIHARDIWAFGATLYEIITGDVPFGQYGGLTQQAQKGKIPPITNNVSDELKQLIYDCLSLESWNRPDAGKILNTVKQHRAGKKIVKKKYRKVIAGTVAAVMTALCVYAFYSFILHTEKKSGDNIAIMNETDSIFLSHVNEAIMIVQSEILKDDISAVDEAVLCSAAKVYAEAYQLDVSDPVRQQGNEIWAPSQEFLDKTYEYLHDKGSYYKDIDAESASREFDRRSMLLANFVTPSRKRQQLYSANRSSAMPARKGAADLEATKKKDPILEIKIKEGNSSGVQITPQDASSSQITTIEQN